MARTSLEIRLKIREATKLIVDYLVFELEKPVRVEKSICSGSAYIHIDNRIIKISDHNFNRKGRGFFIDVRIFFTVEDCLKYFIANCIN